jgi:hypothetical protein
MATFILGPYYLKTKGGYTTAQAFIPGFVSGVSNFPNGGSSGYATTGQNQTIQSIMGSSTVPATITTSRLADSGAVSYLMGGPLGGTHLRIYKGTRPAVTSMTSLANYDSDLLIDFSIPSFSAGGFKFMNISLTRSPKISSTYNNYGDGFSVIAGICPAGAVASQSGAATWFWFGNYNSPTNLTDVAFVTGSIGGASSSNDLIMSNTSVVSGTKYFSSGFRIDFPAFYTI